MGLYNNEREIRNKYRAKMRARPDEATAQKLEILGDSVDFSNADWGEPPAEVREYLGGCTEEELGELLRVTFD